MRHTFAIISTSTTRSLGRRLLIPGMLAVALVVGVGIAAGTIPGSDGVIHGCYNTGSNPSGQVRVVDAAAGGKCTKNEKSLDFNQTGPRGATGATGATGPDGTSTVYTAGGTNLRPTSVEVPAGNYLVVGSAVIYNSATDPRSALCTLQDDDGNVDETVVAQVTLGFGFQTVPIVGTAVLAGDGTISFDCDGADIGTATTFLSATKVTSIVTP